MWASLLIGWGLLAAAVGGARAQSLEPRLYANAPVGMNFLVAGYGLATGGLSVNPEVGLTDAGIRVDSGVLAYARVFGWGGRTGKIDLIVPSMCIDAEARYRGAPVSRSVCGIGDVKGRVSWNLYGSPALGLEAFRSYRQDTIVGASFQFTAPTGQYDSARLINVGANRWGFKPGVGVSKAVGRFVLEFTADAELYSVKPPVLWSGVPPPGSDLLGPDPPGRAAPGRPAGQLPAGGDPGDPGRPQPLGEAVLQQRGEHAHRDRFRSTGGRVAVPVGGAVAGRWCPPPPGRAGSMSGRGFPKMSAPGILSGNAAGTGPQRRQAMKILVDPEKCTGSGRCVKACPEHAISLEGGTAVIDAARCDLDGICLPACPNGAISLLEDED